MSTQESHALLFRCKAYQPLNRPYWANKPDEDHQIGVYGAATMSCKTHGKEFYFASDRTGIGLQRNHASAFLLYCPFTTYKRFERLYFDRSLIGGSASLRFGVGVDVGIWFSTNTYDDESALRTCMVVGVGTGLGVRINGDEVN